MPAKTDLSQLNCSLAGALGIVGDWWSLLIVRDAMLGACQFGEFQRSLGLAKNMLADRLKRLVADGVLLREGPERRPTYRLTEKGQALAPALIALMQWGDRWTQNRQPPVIVRDSDGCAVDDIVLTAGGRQIAPADMVFAPGPGAQLRTRLFLGQMAQRRGRK